jgi:hypothetical protein
MGNYSNFLFKAASVHKLSDCQDGLIKLRRANPKAWWLGWMSLVWFDPDLPVGSVDKLSTAAFFEDLGLAMMRDRWGPDGVAAMFKCGPFGGYRLNAFRNANGYKYINVAHDDPDANSFLLFADGRMLAETDRYSKHKQSANHNTILVGGVGQTVTGRKEGGVWTQPGRGDMTKMAVVTGFRDGGRTVIIDGEAGGSYPAIKDVRPGLERFRRTFIWVEGRYVLVLDDIRAPEPVEIAWLLQGADLKPDEAGDGRYVLSKGEARCPLRVVSDKPLSARIVASPADDRGKALGWKQLRLTGEIERLRLVSVYDLWNAGADVEVKWSAPGRAVVTVRCGDHTDKWRWEATQKRFESTRLRRGDSDEPVLSRPG